MAKKPVTVEADRPTGQEATGGASAADRPVMRRWFVRVHKIEPATVQAADEEGAKAAYRELRGFLKTSHPYEVREVGAEEG